MGKRSERTPRSKVRQALRQLWLRSRERAAVLKAESYTCQECNKKQSKAKGHEQAIEVHHVAGVEWEALIDEVYKVLLVHPDQLAVLCPECHKAVHKEVK